MINITFCNWILLIVIPTIVAIVGYMVHKYRKGRKHIQSTMLKNMNIYRVVANIDLLEEDTKFTKLKTDAYNPFTYTVIADYFVLDNSGNLTFYKKTDTKESELIYAVSTGQWFDCLKIQ